MKKRALQYFRSKTIKKNFEDAKAAWLSAAKENRIVVCRPRRVNMPKTPEQLIEQLLHLPSSFQA